MLAQRVERDPLDDDHLAVADVEDGAVDQPVRVDAVAAGQLEPHPVHPLGRAQQPLALGVLADLDEDLADGLLDAAVGRAGPRALEPVRGSAFATVGSPSSPRLDLLDELAHVRLQIASDRSCRAGRVGMGWLLLSHRTPQDAVGATRAVRRPTRGRGP